MENETAGYRRKRKEDAKSLKRERIVKAGGVRPRHIPPDGSEKCLCPVKESSAKTANFQTTQRPTDSRNRYSDRNASTSQNHRFGRVMEKVPCRNQPRFSTLSIAIPGSIVANCQTRELKTQIAGQIARAATIYHVDEIIVFDDKLSKSVSLNNYYRNRDDSKRRHFERTEEFNKETKKGEVNSQEGESSERSRSSDPHAFMARVLQYCGCPQYLRRHFFPMHPDLQFAGLLAPVDAPHHVRAEDRCPFREGVILDKTKGTGSLVNCGIRGRPVHIDQRLQPGIRCTVQLDPTAYGRPGPIHGIVVSPSTVTQTDGTYWGYTVRIAASIKAVFDECPYAEKYDLTIGTSERGHESIDDPNFVLLQKSNNKSSGGVSSYRHALIVFGGVAGIEECVDADESLQFSGSASSTMFDKWINVCPYQGSRTIRSEEAVLITLAKLSPLLANAKITKYAAQKEVSEKDDTAETFVNLKDEVLSEESSDSDDSSSDEVG